MVNSSVENVNNSPSSDRHAILTIDGIHRVHHPDAEKKIYTIPIYLEYLVILTGERVFQVLIEAEERVLTELFHFVP